MKILATIGTRPEMLKLKPVLDALQERGVETEVFFTNQSPDLVEDLDSASYGHPIVEMSGRWAGLNDGIQRVMFEMQWILKANKADAVLVQGDTASAFAGALAAFLAEVPVGHVEAGLRTYRETPWPEEAFRGAIARFARWHFCPDKDSHWNVLTELGKVQHQGHKKWAVNENVYVTGNTIVDTLPNRAFHILATLHRRENWGEPIDQALHVLNDFVKDHENAVVDVVWHPNWSEHLPYDESEYHLGRIPPQDAEFPYIAFMKPLGHDFFVEIMEHSSLILTDSGGLQEEAAHFGVDCIVYREATERTALERQGAVEVVDPSKPERLREALENRLQKRRAYGNGDAGEQIANILVKELQDE